LVRKFFRVCEKKFQKNWTNFTGNSMIQKFYGIGNNTQTVGNIILIFGGNLSRIKLDQYVTSVSYSWVFMPKDAIKL